jgi:hypothetical protein
VNKAKIDQALQDLANRLPEAPKWMILVRRNGEFVSRIGEFINLPTGTQLEDNWAATLTHTHAMHEIHMLDGTQHGTFQHSISVGSDGIYFIVHLNDAYVLGVSYQWIGVQSIDAIVEEVTTNFYPVLEALTITE